MKYKYCTLFDKNYLPHALTLCDSLEKNVSDYLIFCFCMDEESLKYFQKNKKKNIIPISFIQLEEHFPDLLIAKSNRSTIEYYFTCSSAICSFLFDHYPEYDLITYLDADLYFYSSPDPLYDELNNASVGIIEHRFSFFGKRFKKYGRFNVGWVSFRNDESGRLCLENWRLNCINWCYDRLENGLFADQKYLDYWPGEYKGVHIIQHQGANLAPWNIGRYHLNIDKYSNHILINEKELIFYHFASLKQITSIGYITNISKYMVCLTGIIRNNIYLPYIYDIRKHNNLLNIKFNSKNRTEHIYSSLFNKLKSSSRKFRQIVCNDFIEI